MNVVGVASGLNVNVHRLLVSDEIHVQGKLRQRGIADPYLRSGVERVGGRSSVCEDDVQLVAIRTVEIDATATTALRVQGNKVVRRLFRECRHGATS
jgi:hypothetical protein